MGKIYYTKEELEKLTIGDLRNVHVGLGGVPANKPKAMLIDEITKIIRGESVPMRCGRGRPSTRVARVTQEDCVRDIGSLPDECEGYVEICPGDYGFVRADYFKQSQGDAFIPVAVVKKYSLRDGDLVKGKLYYKRENKYPEMLKVTHVNGDAPKKNENRPDLDALAAYYPNSIIRLGAGGDGAMRLVDAFCPIGKGQRTLVVTPRQADGNEFLKKVALATEKSHPEINVIVLLIGEYPEDVTEFKRGIKGEVMASTFDKTNEHHVCVAEKCFNRARALVESGKDVMVLVDSVTRLARAYNTVVASNGKKSNDAVDYSAIESVKKYFGYAKCTDVGSLTVIATLIKNVGNDIDDFIFNEFDNTGNSEIVLTDKSEDSEVSPVIDVIKSSTRKDDLLLGRREKTIENEVREKIMRKELTLAEVVDAVKRTVDNDDFYDCLEELK